MNTYTSKIKKEHGIMFHHFHKNKKFPKSPGSINLNQLEKIIKYVGKRNIINAEEFLERKIKNNLNKKNICITFDDGLKSQMITLKLLKKYSIQAFFFINTKYIDYNNISPELTRYFIYIYCKGMKNFYKIFAKNCSLNLNIFFKNKKSEIKKYKLKYKFYSIEDIKFRIIRNYLDTSKFNSIIEKIMFQKKFDKKKIVKNLYMSKKDLIKINKMGHIIGLHSHSHPMKISKLSKDIIKKEFVTNKNCIKRIIGSDKIIKAMSHPTGSCSKDTKKILKSIGIKIGFSNIENKKNRSNFEISRINHKYILQKIHL